VRSPLSLTPPSAAGSCLHGYYYDSADPERQHFIGDQKRGDADGVLGEEARAHACVACPHGAICDDIGGNRSEAQHNTQLTLRLNTTWWRAREDSTDLRVCLPPYACDEPIAARCSPAANESAWCAGDALCRPFHHGPRCAVCDAGAFRHVDGGCVECEKAALPAVIGTSSAFGLVVAVALCSWIRCAAALASAAAA